MINKIKESFLNMFKNEKKQFILLMMSVGVVFVYLLGTLFPFIVGNILINGKASYIQFPGAVIGFFFLLVGMFGYLYASLLKPDLSKKIYLGAIILASVMFLWGVIMHRVGASGTAVTNGFGKIVMFLMLGLMYFIHFGHKLYDPWLDKLMGLICKEHKTKTEVVEE